jgi:ferrochelatase
VADHLEVLYDLDVEAKRVADEHAVAFGRTASLNAEPTVMAALARVVVAAADPSGTAVP